MLRNALTVEKVSMWIILAISHEVLSWFADCSVVHFVKWRAFLYVVVQSGGAVVGALILKGLVTEESLCTSKPSKGVSLGQVFGYEVIITFVLVMTVFATCDSLRSGFGGSGPLTIGLSVSMCHLWAVRTTFKELGDISGRIWVSRHVSESI